jgi:hypothetical protein
LVSSTADALARIKKKAAAAAAKQAAETASAEQAAAAAGGLSASSSVPARAFASSEPVKPVDRVAQLAAQLEEARAAAGHRAYDSLPEDDTSRALKAAAARSAARMSMGLTGSEERGGLHVRKRAGDEALDEARSKKQHAGDDAFAFASRTVGPAQPRFDSEPDDAQMSVEWTPPAQSTAHTQDKLRAKFAGKY